VKNLRKDRGYYWVYAEVSQVLKDGKVVEYKSLREPVSREKRIEMQRLYDRMRSEEEGSSRVVMYVSNEKLEELKQFEL
jgi:aerotaxis receptor